MSKKTKNRVQLSSDATQSTSLFGIASTEAVYKLSVLINQSLGNSLQSTEPVLIIDGNKTASFPRFTDKSDLPHSSISLTQNRSEKQTLIKKFPKIDYLLVKSVESGTMEEHEKFASRLRGVNHITAVFIIDTDSVESSLLEEIVSVD